MSTEKPVAFADLETDVNDLSNMAKLLSNAAEGIIVEGSRLSADKVRMLMFAIYEVELMSRSLRERYYTATEAHRSDVTLTARTT